MFIVNGNRGKVKEIFNLLTSEGERVTIFANKYEEKWVKMRKNALKTPLLCQKADFKGIYWDFQHIYAI